MHSSCTNVLEYGEGNGMNRLTFFAGLACALLLAGCLPNTKDEPFSLEGGDRLPVNPSRFLCRGYDEKGNEKKEEIRSRLIELQKNHHIQYVFPGETEPVALVFTAHRVREDVYIISTVLLHDPGETLAALFIKDGVFTLVAYGGERMDTLALKHHVSMDKRSSTINGRVEDQRAFMLDLASSREGSAPILECTPNPVISRR